MTVRSFWQLLMAALFLCTACASAPSGTTVRGTGDPSVSLAEYRLSVGDRVRVNVFGEKDLSGEFAVEPDGSASLPLIGHVKAEGATVPEFSAAVVEGLGRYIRQPNVTVEVINYRPFFILGEVQTPGTYPYAVGLTVMNAVATAGGFSDRAASRQVYIRRAGQDREQLVPLTGGVLVQPGDTIRIPERRLY